MLKIGLENVGMRHYGIKRELICLRHQEKHQGGFLRWDCLFSRKMKNQEKNKFNYEIY